MTYIVPRKEGAEQSPPASLSVEAVTHLTAGPDLSRTPHRTTARVLSFPAAPNGVAMRKALNRVAAESADLNISHAVALLQVSCSNRIMARLFDLARANVDGGTV